MATATQQPDLQQDSQSCNPDQNTSWSTESGEVRANGAAHADLSGENSFQHKLIMSLAVVLPFLGFVAVVVLAWTVGWMNWFFLGMLVAGWLITGTGITVGFHRLLTHRSFETYPALRAFWMVMGAFAVQGSPLTWCSVHRRHHERSDMEGDPHSPYLHGTGWWNWIKGFVHSHTGWLFSHYWNQPAQARYVPDLMKEPLLVRIDQKYYLCVLASLLIPTAIGGLVTMSWMGALFGFLWGGLARVFVVHHVTWSINSVCHIFGSREYESDDHSKNNVLCGTAGTRRRLAQQPPRVSLVSTAWIEMVAIRHVLVHHPIHAVRRPCVERSTPERKGEGRQADSLVRPSFAAHARSGCDRNLYPASRIVRK